MGFGKLSRRLFVLTLVALLPVAVVLFYNLDLARQVKAVEIEAEAMRAGQLGALEIQRIIHGVGNVLIAMSASNAVQHRELPRCQDYVQRVTRRLTEFTTVGIADTTGTIICPSTSDGTPTTVAAQNYFREAMTTGKIVVGEYMAGPEGDRPVLPIAEPIIGDDGKILGVIFGDLRLDWLAERLNEGKLAPGGLLTVTDRNGVIVARLPDAGGLVGTTVPARYRSYVNAAQPMTVWTTGIDGIERVFGLYPVSTVASGLFVSAGISVDNSYASIRRMSWLSLVAGLASVVLSLLLAWLTSKRLIQHPVNQLVAAIQGWRDGDRYSRTLMSEREGEFGVVGQAIDDFLTELVLAREATERANTQRELVVRELDHRMKNLLVTVQSVVRQSFKSGSSIADATTALNLRLAAIGEAHSLLMRDSWRAAAMRDIVAAATHAFDDGASGQFSVEGPELQVKAKAVFSLSMALHELCTNASKYGALKTSGGVVHISWQVVSPAEGRPGVFRLDWREEGGPPVLAPTRFGFGTKMIEQVLGYELEARVQVDYAETGVTCQILAPLEKIIAGSSALGRSGSPAATASNGMFDNQG